MHCFASLKSNAIITQDTNHQFHPFQQNTTVNCTDYLPTHTHDNQPKFQAANTKSTMQHVPIIQDNPQPILNVLHEPTGHCSGEFFTYCLDPDPNSVLTVLLQKTEEQAVGVGCAQINFGRCWFGFCTDLWLLCILSHCCLIDYLMHVFVSEWYLTILQIWPIVQYSKDYGNLCPVLMLKYWRPMSLSLHCLNLMSWKIVKCQFTVWCRSLQIEDIFVANN